jgi:hypothetical protein
MISGDTTSQYIHENNIDDVLKTDRLDISYENIRSNDIALPKIMTGRN